MGAPGQIIIVTMPNDDQKDDADDTEAVSMRGPFDTVEVIVDTGADAEAGAEAVAEAVACTGAY